MNWFTKLKLWQIIVAGIILTMVGGLASGNPGSEDKLLYTRQLAQAPWAPPSWVFAPAWTIIDIALLFALQKMLREYKKHSFELMIQVGIWFIFFTFNYIYFNKKSTILAAVWTITDAILATITIYSLIKKKSNIKYYFLPLLFWTIFASTVATYQALYNRDTYLNIPAFINE